MSIFVTMKVGPVDWLKFAEAMEAMKNESAPGRESSVVYRDQHDANIVLVAEVWDSHDSMHAYQDRVGDKFNGLAGTEGMDWDVTIWDEAGAM